MKYKFPGIRKFVCGEGLGPSLASQVMSLESVGRIATALSQYAAIPEKDRAAVRDYIAQYRQLLACGIRTIDAATEEVYRECQPTPAPTSSSPKRPR